MGGEHHSNTAPWQGKQNRKHRASSSEAAVGWGGGGRHRKACPVWSPALSQSLILSINQRAHTCHQHPSTHLAQDNGVMNKRECFFPPMLLLLSLLFSSFYTSMLHHVLPWSLSMSLQLSVDNDKRAVTSSFKKKKH